MVGSPGQGAYAAANSWLDAFTHWRRAQGLACQRHRVGCVGRDRRGHGMAEDGDAAICPDDGAYAFESLLALRTAATPVTRRSLGRRG